jgi:uncharacterized repeat protein (TIGR01451 family)
MRYLSVVLQPARLLRVLAVALGVVLAGTAVAQAATLNVVFDDTSPGASTGSAPFDALPGAGNDIAANDHVVRTHDTITYHWGLSANGGRSPDTTVTQTLPAGMAWTGLPAYCGRGTPDSSLSADRRTIVCNTGTQGSSAVDLYPTAILTGDLQNGDTLTTAIEVSSSDPGTATARSGQVTDTVSATARVNLQKRGFFTTQAKIGGVTGVTFSYSLSLVVENAGGKGLRGAETIVQPITLTDDLGQFLPDAQFVGFTDPSGGANIPWGRFASGRTAENSVPDSGTWAGVQAGGPGNPVAITVTGADLRGNTVPRRSASGARLPASDLFLATKIITFFVPSTSIPAGPNDFQNEVRDFDPNSLSGQSNYGAGLEPLPDNLVRQQYTKPVGPGGWAKYYTDDSTTNGLLAGASGPNGGDGLLFRGQTFQASHDWDARNAELRDYHDVVLCDNFDNSSVRLSTDMPASAGGAPGPAWLKVPATQAANWVIEYATGGTRGATAAEWYAADGPQSTTCEDADAGPGGWVSDPATLPGGIDAATKVRARSVAPIDPVDTGYMGMVVNYEVRSTDYYSGDPVVPGRKVANFMRFGEDPENDGSRTWPANTYRVETNSNTQGMVATVAGGIVRVDKETTPLGKTTALSGEVVDYTVQPSASAFIPSGSTADPFTMRDVRVVDTIPDQMTYVAGSASQTPESVVVNPDGTTTVTWALGDVHVNGVLAAITYRAKVKLTAPNGAQEVNTVVISSPDDASPQIARTNTYTIAVDKVFGIQVVKSTSTPWTEPLDDIVFDLEYVNNAADTVTSLDMIDVLPYDGDDRGAEDSAFHGTARVKSITATAGDAVLYSSRTPAQVSSNPKDASNDLATGATRWCDQAQLGSAGCPATAADATAVRVRRTGSIASGDGGTARLVLATEGNESGDQYVNDAGLAAGGVSLPAFALPVEVQVVASNLGDYVWDDADKDGVQDPGEQGVAGVTVTLRGTDKDGNAVQRSVRTDAAGHYTFASATGGFTLRSGDYALTFTEPDGYGFTALRSGSDARADSDADTASGGTGAIRIASPIPGQADQQDVTYDAGIVRLPEPPAQEPPRTPEEPPATPPTTTPPTTTPTPPPAVAPKPARASGRARRAPQPKLTLKKTSNVTRVSPGELVRYTLTARNTGRGAATHVALCDDLPDHLTLVSRQAALARTRTKLSRGELCWTIGTLKPGQTLVRTFAVRVDGDAPSGAIVNRATLDRTRAKGTDASAKRTVTVGAGGTKPAFSSGGVTG